MKRIQLLAFISMALFTSTSFAQVTFFIDQLPSYTPAQDSIFIAGDFSGWLAGLPEYVLHKNDEGKWSITLAAQPDLTNIAYKFTRGSWPTVEKGASGEELPNRAFTFGNGETVHVNIYNWADNGGGGSTAQANISVMSTDFFIPQLNRNRRIWLYLPPDYETSGLNYPVIYMHDGQNLFDVLSAYAGEWEVDETLNRLASEGYKVPIVVGIDNGGADRLGEYTPWANTQDGGGEGKKYMQFIVETLKPYIDQHYRTLPDRGNTGLMGSSLGGLISHFGALNYQDVFSKAGLFSVSYWFSDSIWSYTHQTGKQDEMRFFQLCGSYESSGQEAIDMQRMNDSLVRIGFLQDNIFNKVVTGGEHNEKLWREAFAGAYLWLFDSFANTVNEPFVKSQMIIYPNPVNDLLTLPEAGKKAYDTVVITDIKGREVKSFSHPKNNEIDVHSLAAGSYIVKCKHGDVLWQAKFIKN